MMVKGLFGFELKATLDVPGQFNTSRGSGGTSGLVASQGMIAKMGTIAIFLWNSR